jgi:hypothetical protein
MRAAGAQPHEGIEPARPPNRDRSYLSQSLTLQRVLHTPERNGVASWQEGALGGARAVWWSEAWSRAHLGHSSLSRRATAERTAMDSEQMGQYDQCILRMLHVASGCACLHAVVLHSSDFCTGRDLASIPGIEGGEEGAEFVGPAGLVVWWLKVQSVTALVMSTMRPFIGAMHLQHDWPAMCVLYLLSLFQTAWFLVGCVFSFSHGTWGVPAGCREGSWGNKTAFVIMWWVSAVWAAVVGLISLLACFVGCIQLGRVRRMSQWVKYSKRAKHRLDQAQAAGLRAPSNRWDERSEGGVGGARQCRLSSGLSRNTHATVHTGGVGRGGDGSGDEGGNGEEEDGEETCLLRSSLAYDCVDSDAAVVGASARTCIRQSGSGAGGENERGEWRV